MGAMIEILRGAWATAQFEIQRSMTAQRIALAALLVMFPPGMFLFLALGPGLSDPLAVLFVTTFFVSLVCVLSVLLWATPNVAAELEGKSWAYVTSRPYGRWSLLFGKYLAAVVLSFAVCWLALTACAVLSGVLQATTQIAPTGRNFRAWWSLSIVMFLGCLAYGAVFSLIGTLFQRRAMVIAAGYFLISELLLAWIPALVNKFTIRYHLQFIGLHLLGWFLPIPQDEFLTVYEMYSLPTHLAAIFLATALGLAAAAIVIGRREYVTADET